MSTYTPEQLGIKAPAGGFQTGGWYEGRQYWNGSFSDPGVIHPQSSQQGAGQAVSQEVRAQSAVQQGVTPESFDQFLQNVSASDLQSPSGVPYTTGANESYITGLSQEVQKARQALEQNLADQRAKIQKELEAAKARETAALSEVEKLTTPFREELEKSERERLGTDTVLSEQRQLLSELDKLLTEGNELIRQQKAETGLAAIRNPRIQKTMDDVAARASVINAVVSLQNTYLANAYQSIDRSIGVITQDRTDRLSYYDTILNLANRDIITLTADDKKLAEEQRNLLKHDLERAEKTADYIKELMVNPDTALALAQSGVTLNDTVEVINAKLANYSYSQEVKDAANHFTSQGGVLVSNPASVPADQLRSFTDSRGKTYYYKMPKASSSTSGGGTADDYIDRKASSQVTDTATSSEPKFSPPYSPYIYVDPATGAMWQHTNSGWRKII